jgi:hypothetical protein
MDMADIYKAFLMDNLKIWKDNKYFYFKKHSLQNDTMSIEINKSFDYELDNILKDYCNINE